MQPGSQRNDDDRILQAIVEGVEAETGEEFFRSLVRHLAAALDVQYAFVTEFTEDRTRFRTLALWARGDFGENLEVPLAGTPCEAVLHGTPAHHPRSLQALFPADEALARWGAESYCGVPILDADGTVLGHLAIVDDRPMLDGPRGLSVMRIFAARVRAELERARVERELRVSEERLARVLDSAMDAIVTFDEARRVELFNRAAERLLRLPAAEAIGRPLDRLLAPGFRRALDAALRDGKSWLWAPEGLQVRAVGGRTLMVEATVSRAETAGRRLHTLILRDVEERERAQEELRALHRQNLYLQEEIKSLYNFEEIIGQSRALGEVLTQVGLVAETDSSVLICGETGTGKELIARAVHFNSKRRSRPLIKVNCAALPTGLIESELFGHEKGAFTGAVERRIGRFELADGGTIFLDEIGEVPPEVQVKLLRVLQEREIERIGGGTLKVDVRVIAATNRDLAEAVRQGRFRQDLYYRLNVFPLTLPPLRDRPEDIPLLVHYFVERYAAKIGRRIERVPPGTIARLAAYPWPGNVRELENVVERAVILSPGPELAVPADLLAPALAASAAPAPGASAAGTPAAPVPGAAAPAVPASLAPPEAADPGGGTPLALGEVERAHIVAVLKRTGWRVDGPQGAARILGLNPSTLRSRMQKLGIRRSADERS